MLFLLPRDEVGFGGLKKDPNPAAGTDRCKNPFFRLRFHQ